MNEDFLYLVWERRLYHPFNLCITSGERLEIISPGKRNRYSGPDYTCATIKINEQVLYGDVEIHVRASDWYAHNHHKDETYNNIILHVVFNNDKVVRNNNGISPDSLDISPYLLEKTSISNSKLYKHKLKLSCGNNISTLNNLTEWKTFLARDRIIQKQLQIEAELINTKSDLFQIFYSYFLRCFGMPANTIPFAILSNKVCSKILLKYSDSPFIQKALIMGTSGLLFKGYDEKDKELLVQEFNFFKIKYSIQTMHEKEWKMGGVRPFHSPVNRLKQFFVFLPYLSDLYILCTSNKKPDEIYNKYFEIIEKLSLSVFNASGFTLKNFSSLIWINFILPYIYFYNRGKNKSIIDYVKTFDKIKAESNSITRLFNASGVKINSAIESQALLHLYSNFCLKRKCLECTIFKKVTS